MGASARRFVGLNFGPGRFKVEFLRAVAEARQKWARRRRPADARR
jgi:hypothetical protein